MLTPTEAWTDISADSRRACHSISRPPSTAAPININGVHYILQSSIVRQCIARQHKPLKFNYGKPSPGGFVQIITKKISSIFISIACHGYCIIRCSCLRCSNQHNEGYPKNCKDICEQYQDADHTIVIVRQELETIQTAFQELANLINHDVSALSSKWDTNATLSSTFRNILVSFQQTVTGLEREFEPLKLPGYMLKKSEKVKLLWSKDKLKHYQEQIRGQTGALNLLRQVLQTQVTNFLL